MDATIGQTPERSVGIDPAQRQSEQAQARRAATQSALRAAEASEARRADQREFVRATLERAVGANTRLSIERRPDVPTFIYRAIDRDSGEIVSEWPPKQFVQFLNDNGATAEIINEITNGQLIDEQA